MQRIKLLLLFGGESPEHDVSVYSARNIYAALDDQKYDITLGHIDRKGRWWLIDSLETIGFAEKIELLPMLGEKAFVVQPGAKKLVIDVIMPILHGTNGEDGAVQGLAQLLHIPIVGCGVASSAICMDKDIARRLLRQANILVPDYIVHQISEPLPDFAHITVALGSPLFVKPACQGSSVGVSKVTTREEFAVALEQAHAYDAKVIIEEGIRGRELECAVLGNNKPEVTAIGEIEPEGEFYSYEAKYNPESQSKLTIPADLAEDVSKKIREQAVKAYKTLGCRGLGRADFFLDENGKLYLNEINTLPGFTNISMYPKLWLHEGLHYPDLIDRLVQLALENSDPQKSSL